MHAPLRRVVVSVLVVHALGCDSCVAVPPAAPVAATAPREPSAAAVLLAAAVTAHGGAAALERLDDVRVRSDVEFRDGVRLVRDLHFRAPSAFGMVISRGGAPVMSFGLADGVCWRMDRTFALPCSAGDELAHRRILDVLNARWLHRLDPNALQASGTVSIDGVEAQVLRSGDLDLAFDPATFELLRIEYDGEGGRWAETFSEAEEHGGARVSVRRVLTVAGRPDVTERWIEVVPGGADPAWTTPPPAPTPGTLVEGLDAERLVAWVDVCALLGCADPTSTEARAAEAERALLALIVAHGLRASGTEGLIVEAGAGGERVAVEIEVVRAVNDWHEPPFHIETWPAVRYIGVFQHGPDLRARLDELRAAVDARGARVAADAPYQFLFAPDASGHDPTERFGLLRVVIEP